MKYRKVTDKEVLITYFKLYEEYLDFLYNIPIEIVQEKLQTSLYQIRRAYKRLEKLGYMEKIEIPTECEEYDNGLYTETIIVLKTKAFNITEAGKKRAKEILDE